ncbi:MAG: hypothetical protein OXB93_01265 [Cytophagales bacterium]|nr:hypothetical protein [Cytophagales bacterium]
MLSLKRNFLFFFLFFAGLTLVLGGLVYFFVPENYVPARYPLLMVFFFIQSLIISFLLNRGYRKDRFVLRILFVSVFRFLTGGLCVGVWLYMGLSDVGIFLVHFLILYVLYMASEILASLRRGSGVS